MSSCFIKPSQNTKLRAIFFILHIWIRITSTIYLRNSNCIWTICCKNRKNVHLWGIFKHCDGMFFRSRYFAYLLWRIKMLHTINHWKYPGKNMNNNQKKSANGRWSQSGPFFAIDYHQWKWSCSSAGGILVVFWIYYWCSRMCLLLYLLFRFVCIYADKCTE